jgi:hypothetical protein
VTTRILHGSNGLGWTVDTPIGCSRGPSRSFSYVTCEYTVEVDYCQWTALMDQVFALWDRLGKVLDNDEADDFERLIDHIAAWRKWTEQGWGGIPGKYLGETGPGAP